MLSEWLYTHQYFLIFAVIFCSGDLCVFVNYHQQLLNNIRYLDFKKYSLEDFEVDSIEDLYFFFLMSIILLLCIIYPISFFLVYLFYGTYFSYIIVISLFVICFLVSLSFFHILLDTGFSFIALIRGTMNTNSFFFQIVLDCLHTINYSSRSVVQHSRLVATIILFYEMGILLAEYEPIFLPTNINLLALNFSNVDFYFNFFELLYFYLRIFFLQFHLFFFTILQLAFYLIIIIYFFIFLFSYLDKKILERFFYLNKQKNLF